MIDPRLNRFDRLAPYYDVLANLAFGGAISRSHKQNFHLISNGATVLILGGGSGKWLRDFLNAHPSAKIYFIEASKKMLELAIGRSQNNQQITFIHGTEDDVPSIRFDVVITHFFLDMYSADQLEKLIGKIRYLLERKGVWLVSDFEVVKAWHKPLLNLMYWFFRVAGAIDNRSLPNWNKMIQSRSFRLVNQSSFYGEFIHSRAYVNEVGLRTEVFFKSLNFDLSCCTQSP